MPQKFQNGIITLLLLTFMMLNLTAVQAPAAMAKGKTAAKSLSRLVAKDTEVVETEAQYLLKEKIGTASYRITAISKTTLKPYHSWNCSFKGSGYDAWVSVSPGRFIVRRWTDTSGQRYYNYFVDLAAGRLVNLPETSMASSISSVLQSLWIRGYNFRVQEKRLTGVNIDSFLIQDNGGYCLFNGRSVLKKELGKEGSVSLLGWSPDGKFYVYKKEDCLYLINTADFSEYTVSAECGAGFLAWMPDSHSLLLAENRRLVLFKTDGSRWEIGPYQEFKEMVYETPPVVQWNPDMTKCALQDATNAIHIYNVREERVETTVYKPSGSENPFDSLMDVFWSRDGAAVQFASPRSYGKMQYINSDLYVFNREGEYAAVDLKGGSNNFTYYKNYLIFLTDIEMMGFADQFAHTLAIYNLNSGKLYLIPQIGHYEASPGGSRLIVYSDRFIGDQPASVFDEAKMKIGQPISGLNWRWDNNIAGKKCYISTDKKGTTRITVYDLDKLSSKRLLSLTRKEGYNISFSDNLLAVYVPSRKKIYIYNRTGLHTLTVKGKILTGFSLPSQISGDGRNYCYLEEIKGKVYFKTGII